MRRLAIKRVNGAQASTPCDVWSRCAPAAMVAKGVMQRWEGSRGTLPAQKRMFDQHVGQLLCRKQASGASHIGGCSLVRTGVRCSASVPSPLDGSRVPSCLRISTVNACFCPFPWRVPTRCYLLRYTRCKHWASLRQTGGDCCKPKKERRGCTALVVSIRHGTALGVVRLRCFTRRFPCLGRAHCAAACMEGRATQPFQWACMRKAASAPQRYPAPHPHPLACAAGTGLPVMALLRNPSLA